jgi:ATP-dependent Clp protease ATP-binding subunit ClpC
VTACTRKRILQHGFIATEHLLPGLIREGTGLAVQLMSQVDADLPSLREQVSEELNNPDSTI